jgi:hypothetical protein
MGCTSSDKLPPRGQSDLKQAASKFPRSYTGPNHVSTVDELDRWVESGADGSLIFEFGLSGRTIYIANRYWTPGVYSSEVGVYVPSTSGLSLRYSIPVEHYYHKFAVEGDRLLIFRGDQSRQDRLMIELSSSELFGP